tara:strand:- start:19 stop:309 length:291 start_codon:yes stop_codon:yes gene_type:complete
MDDMQSEMSIDSDGDKRWVVNGKLHREDGPAVEWANGDKEWWQHGQIHRTDGPAIQWHYGAIEWCLHGYCYAFDQWLRRNYEMTDEEKVMMKLQYG